MEQLAQRIETSLMPSVKYKRKINEDTLEEYYEGFVYLHELKRYNFIEEEYDYIFKYLEQKNVIIAGKSGTLYIDYPNYRCRQEHNRLDKNKEMSNKEINELLNKYNKEENKEEKIKIRNKIVLENMKLVSCICKAIAYNMKIDYRLFEGAGYEGLIKAIEKFNPNNGTFSTYATKIIYGYILIELPELYDFYDRNLFFEIKKIKKNLEENSGKKDYSLGDLYEDIIETLETKNKLSSSQMKTIRRKLEFNLPLSIEHKLDNKEDVMNKQDEIEKYLDNKYQEELKKSLDKVLNNLSLEERTMIKELNGYEDGICRSLRDVGNRHNISHEQVRQKTKKIYEKLSFSNELKSYINEAD